MKLEVGQFVRTKEGYIAKFVGKNDYFHSFDSSIRDIRALVYDEDDMLFNDEIKEYIIKVSDDIIDLIQVGDYVNGHKITTINEMTPIVYAEDEQGYLIKIIPKEEIETIVTKELFEDMSYKVASK